MIINNYNSSLKENKESELTFYSLQSPVLNIRGFDFNLVEGETHLVIPYYVSDFYQCEYREDRICSTFTTIFTMDEDKEPLNAPVSNPRDGVWRTWKQTTYAGEQVIDLGVFNDVGIHTLSVRTIQSNGVGSATKFLKFIVRPSRERLVLDLDPTSDGYIGNGGFSSAFNGYSRYNLVWRSDPANCFGPVESEYNCRYVVKPTLLQGKVTDIKIVVIKNSSQYCVVDHDIDDYGARKSTNDGQYDFWGGKFDGGEVSSSELAGVSLSDGEVVVDVFHVATECNVSVGNQYNKVKLTDYINSRAADLPDEVIDAAAKNKVALTRLFEAAKAYAIEHGYDDELVLKMPQMEIVCDYHFASVNDPAYKDNMRKQDTDSEPKDAKYQKRRLTGRSDILVPDGITIDLNGSTISVLQVKNVYNGEVRAGDVHGGSILRVINNVDSHIINGKFVGNYKGFEFYHGYDAESLHVLGIYASLFCSFENLDISFATGYEMHIGTREGALIGYNDAVFNPFRKYGYIDYDGVEHDLSRDGRAAGWAYTAADLSANYAKDGLCKILNYGWTVCGREFRVIRDNRGLDYHSLTCKDMFIHFYDMNGNFVKTVKVLQRWPVLIPYGAWKMRMTMYGTLEEDKTDSLNTKSGSKIYGGFVRDFCNFSWCSGLYNSSIHDTRSCTLDNGGVQTTIKNIKFWNVAAERYGRTTQYEGDDYFITKMLVDYEDDSHQLFNCLFENCEMLFGDNRGVNIVRGYESQFKNCRNIHLTLWEEVHDVLIEDSDVSLEFRQRFESADSHVIIRNCRIKSINNLHSSDYSPFRIGAATGELWLRHNVLFRTPRGSLAGKVHVNNEIKI